MMLNIMKMRLIGCPVCMAQKATAEIVILDCHQGYTFCK